MFFCICRTTGLYTKTLAKIIRQDVTRFMVVFAVVFLSFCGSLFLSLRSSTQSQQFRCVLFTWPILPSVIHGTLLPLMRNDNSKKNHYWRVFAFIRVELRASLISGPPSRVRRGDLQLQRRDFNGKRTGNISYRRS